MKKWLLGVMTVLMAVSLAACTPTTEKQKKETTAAAAQKPEEMIPPSTGGASDKVPDPNVMPVAVVSIYHKGDGDTMVQDMDSLDTEGLDAQLLVDKLMEYGVLTEGTEVISFTVEGSEEDASGTLNLNQAESAEGSSKEMFLTELGNTFTENFELTQLKLQVNGADYEGGEELTYNAAYEDVE
ncbi:MAG: GerMN domain-containing protein [Enterocloster sp.]